jgi:hypothetical protein
MYERSKENKSKKSKDKSIQKKYFSFSQCLEMVQIEYVFLPCEIKINFLFCIQCLPFLLIGENIVTNRWARSISRPVVGHVVEFHTCSHIVQEGKDIVNGIGNIDRVLHSLVLLMG